MWHGLTRLVHKAGGESATAAAAAVVALVQADWRAVEGDVLDGDAPADDSFSSGDGLPTAAYLQAAVPSSGLVHTALLRRVLLAALEHFDSPEVRCKGKTCSALERMALMGTVL